MSQLVFGFGAAPEGPRAQGRSRRAVALGPKPPEPIQLGFGDIRPRPPGHAATTPTAVSVRPERPDRPERGGLAAGTIRGQVRLEETLRRLLDRPVLISLTTNRSTMISFRKRGRAISIRAHAMFQEAPDAVLEAMAAFVSLKEMPKSQAKLLDDWIERHRDDLTEARAQSMRLQPTGEVHDLIALYQRLNEQYFDGRIEAQITWSRSARKLRRSTIRMGTYSHDLRLIRIHPALDQEFVPDFFVEFVVFHEMLHQVHHRTDSGCERRAVHTPEFRSDERRYRRYREARSWEQQHLPKLLRY
jgi:hypothetical protein